MLGAAEAKSKEAEELEYLRNEMYRETLESEQRRLEELRMRKKLEDRHVMLQAYEHSMVTKEEKRQLEVVEENKLREMLLAKYAEDDRIDQLNDHRRRMKVQEHKRKVEEQVQIRHE